MGLSQLWQLQELQLRQQDLQKKLQTSTLARELKKEKKRLEIFQGATLARGGELEQINKKIAQLEYACQSLQDKRNKVENNLYSGATNNPKELNNLQHQVETTIMELSRQEDKVVELTEKREQLEKWMTININRLHTEKAAYREKLTQYRAWRESLMQEMDILKATVSQLESEIEPKLRSFYTDLQQRLGVMALARAVKGTCSGCNLMIPPVLLLDIRAGQRVYCENCGRLILP